MVAFTNNVQMICECPFCGEESLVIVDKKDYTNWQNGLVSQKAFPYLNADDRELLQTGICKDCWPKEPEDED